VTPTTDAAATLPSGVVTFLFTDIEGSTRLAHELGEAWFGVLQDHHRIIREVLAESGGHEVSTAGDSFFAAFASAADAIACTVELQRAIAGHDWTPQPIRVRMGLHTGDATLHDDDYVGLTVHAAARVESAAAGGQVLLTEATLSAARAALPEGIEFINLGQHRLKDLPAKLELYQIVADGLHRDFPPVRSLDVIRNNVPVPVSTFVGRVDALTKLQRLMDSDRLVTLVGPGGAGKTRLSLKLALERLHRYADGVWFVELDPAHDAAGVAGAVADALRVREEPGRPLLDTLVDHVRERDLLFVFDNCEHVIDDAAVIVDRLLRGSPKVHVLATSREPLAIEGERLWPVPPLTIDDETPEASEAVRLLVERVQLVRPDFDLSADDISAAVQICRRLDGMPLALELAAASAAMLDLADIAARLDNRFELLTKGRRTSLDRQRTLWGAIDWSYDLLHDDDRKSLRQLGVFPGEFDIETVARVFDRPEVYVADVITRLAAKSLVTLAPSGRYRMLESIRDYARERLESEGELEAEAERHATWFAAAVMDTRSSPTWARDFDLLEVVYDDVVAALHFWASHDPLLSVRLLDPLHRFWARTGRWAEGRAIGEEILEATRDLTDYARGNAARLVAELALNQGDYDAARAGFIANAEIQRELGDESGEKIALGNLGMVAIQQGDLEAAERYFAVSLEGSRAADRKSETAKTLAHLADIARHRGDLDQAWERGSQALAAARELGYDELADGVVNLLGWVAHQRGDMETAERLYREALASARASNDTEPILYLVFCLGTFALDAGRLDEATPLLLEAVKLGRDVHAQADLAESLEAVARHACMSGEPWLAAELLAVVDSLRDAIGFPRPPAEVGAYDALVAEVKKSSGDAAFADHWTAGQAAALDDAVDVALSYLQDRGP